MSNYTPELVRMAVYNAVIKIVREKQISNVKPDHALEREVTARLNFNPQDVIDTLSYLVVKEVLTTGPTMNDTYYRLND